MAKTPQKAWNSKSKERESAVAVSLPYLHEDDEAVRLRGIISGKTKNENEKDDSQ